MQFKNRTELWNHLSSKNLVEGTVSKKEFSSPWYIKLVLAISGGISTILLLIFIGWSLYLIFHDTLLELAPLHLIIGVGLVWFSSHSFRNKPSEFLESSLLTLSLAGQVLAMFGLVELFNISDSNFTLLTIALQAFLIWYVPNYIHKLFSSFLMAIVTTLYFNDIDEFFVPEIIIAMSMVWLWMNEFKFKNRETFEAVAYGQTFALVAVKLFNLTIFNHYISSNKIYFTQEISSFFIVSIFLFLIWKIFQEHRAQSKMMFAYLALIGAVSLLISIEIDGFILSLIFLFIGFAHRHYMFVGLGVLSLLYFLSSYYYYLGDTLMDKAIVLAIMGSLFLAIRVGLKYFASKGANNA